MHLFIDSFNALLSEFEANAFHIFTHTHAKLTDKIETFSMELLSFKSEVNRNIYKLIKVWTAQKSSQTQIEGKQILEKLNTEIQANNQKLYRMRLHNILKKKALRKQKQSMLTSQNFIFPNRELQQLQKSILLIEKDLGIQNENEQNQKLGITRIINKSLSIGLESTPISKIKTNQSIISDASSQMDITSKDMQFDFLSSKPKQNQEANQKFIEVQAKASLLSKKPLGKKKKIVVSKSDLRQGLLGNLLQETYNQLDKK